MPRFFFFFAPPLSVGLQLVQIILLHNVSDAYVGWFFLKLESSLRRTMSSSHDV